MLNPAEYEYKGPAKKSSSLKLTTSGFHFGVQGEAAIGTERWKDRTPRAQSSMRFLNGFVSQTSSHSMVKFPTIAAHDSQGRECRRGPGIETPGMCPVSRKQDGVEDRGPALG